MVQHKKGNIEFVWWLYLNFRELLCEIRQVTLEPLEYTIILCPKSKSPWEEYIVIISNYK